MSPANSPVSAPSPGGAGHGRSQPVPTRDQLRAIGRCRSAAEEMLARHLLEARQKDAGVVVFSAEGATGSGGPVP